jgi:glycosyltransferase involved in cell wall biosynthesis
MRSDPMQSDRRLLHVINTLEVGGGATHLRLLLPRLAALGYSSGVIAGCDGPVGIELRKLGMSVKILGPLGLAAPVRLAALLAPRRPDILHVHGGRAGLAGALAGRATGTRPIVYTAHAFAFKRHLPPIQHAATVLAERASCRLADAVICLSADDALAAAERGIAPRTLAVIPNGIDPAAFPAAADRRAEFGLSPGVPVIGMIGRLVADKDPLTFVRAAAQIRERVPDARFLLVGDGPLRSLAERETAALGLNGRLILTGTRFDIPEVLGTVDVMVMTSLWEGLPLILLEAMASRIPVVCSRLPTLAGVVEDGRTGLLVPPGDAAGFAAAVVELWKDPRRRQRMGDAARDRVAREYSIVRMVQQTDALYTKVLTARGGSLPRARFG